MQLCDFISAWHFRLRFEKLTLVFEIYRQCSDKRRGWEWRLCWRRPLRMRFGRSSPDIIGRLLWSLLSNIRSSWILILKLISCSRLLFSSRIPSRLPEWSVCNRQGHEGMMSMVSKGKLFRAGFYVATWWTLFSFVLRLLVLAVAILFFDQFFEKMYSSCPSHINVYTCVSVVCSRICSWWGFDGHFVSIFLKFIKLISLTRFDIMIYKP